MDFTGTNTEWVDIFPFQVIFPTQGLNLHLLKKVSLPAETLRNIVTASYSERMQRKSAKGKRLPSKIQRKLRVGF